MLYHVTPSENVESILKNGLVPTIGSASRQNGEEHPYVYLFTSLDWVKEGVETWLGEVYWDKDLSVLAIKATPKELGADVNGGEVLVDGTIPPSLIRELYPPERIEEALGLWKDDCSLSR